MKQLPNKPSALLRIAVADAQKCATDPRYRLDMGTWHSPSTKRCVVCMAGAVMAQTLETPVSRATYPGEFGRDNARALQAIDDMRTGHVDAAIETLAIAQTTDEQDVAIDKANDLIGRAMRGGYWGRAPWKSYIKAADILEQAGL